MKYKKIIMICLATVFCMTCSMQPVCAQEIVQTGVESVEDAPADDLSEVEKPSGDVFENTDPTGDSAEEEKREDEQVQELPLPAKVTGLHTTCESDERVLLEWNPSEGASYYKVYRQKQNGSYKKLGETEQASYTDTTVVYGKTYEYMIIPYNQENQEGGEGTIHLAHTQAVNIKTQKYTYQQMKTDMGELVRQYSDYCELTPIGTSVEGRTIYDFAIGNPEAQQSLLVVSTLHAREYICSAVLMQEIEYYLRNYHNSLKGTTPAKVLKNMQIHYIVMANPDGVTISQTKNARWKANSRGVDLNANFPAKNFTVVGKPGAAGYSGKRALSEPETKAVSELTKSLKKNQQLLGVVNYHAMGQIVFGDCMKTSMKKDTQTMYRIARNLTGYQDAGGYSTGKASGGGAYREYVMYLLNIPSITIEIGCTTAPCSFWEYESAFKKNKLVVLKIADAL